MFGRYRRTPAVVSDPALLNAPQLMVDPQDPNDPLGRGYGDDGSAYYGQDGAGYVGEDEDAEDVLRAIRDGDAPLYVAQAKRMHRGFHSEMSSGAVEDSYLQLAAEIVASKLNMVKGRPIAVSEDSGMYDAPYPQGLALFLTTDSEGEVAAAFGDVARAVIPRVSLMVEETIAIALYKAPQTKGSNVSTYVVEAAPSEGVRTKPIAPGYRPVSTVLEDGAVVHGFRKYGDTIITNPAFLNAAQDFYGSDLGDPGDTSEGLMVVGNVDDEDLNPGDLIEDIRARGRRPTYHLGAGGIKGHAGAGSVGALYGNILENALVRAEGRAPYRLGVMGADDESEEDLDVFYGEDGELRSRRATKRTALKGRKALKQVERQSSRLGRQTQRAADRMSDLFPAEAPPTEPEVEFSAYYRAVKRVGRQSQRLANQTQRAADRMADAVEPTFPGEEGASGFRKYGDTIITNPAFLNAAQDFYGSDLGDPGDTSEGLMVVGNVYRR